MRPPPTLMLGLVARVLRVPERGRHGRAGALVVGGASSADGHLRAQLHVVPMPWVRGC